jgi:hypothetical protein
MDGAIPPLPQYAFMAWCLVKKKTLMENCNFTFNIPHTYVDEYPTALGFLSLVLTQFVWSVFSKIEA